jgi:hypothetical protein
MAYRAANHNHGAEQRGKAVVIMVARTLNSNEWKTFFDCFSRQFQGQKVTVTVDTPEAEGRALMRDVALSGIAVQEQEDGPTEIDLSAYLMPDRMMTHVIHNATQVEVLQVTNGHDERLVIRSATDPTTYVDFTLASVAVGGTRPC